MNERILFKLWDVNSHRLLYVERIILINHFDALPTNSFIGMIYCCIHPDEYGIAHIETYWKNFVKYKEY